MQRFPLSTFGLLLTVIAGCAPFARAGSSPGIALNRDLHAIIRRHTGDAAEIAVAFRDLRTGDSLLINAHVPLHAASTMKVPVMLELFRRGETGGTLPVRNSFVSIADGSSYSLSPADDSDTTLYARIGQQVPVRELIDRMITRSSNLATNLLIARADPARIAATLQGIGASGMRVLRGVEDNVAYTRGMNNTTSAYGLMRVMEAVAREGGEMVEILSRQEFREMIPAGVPPGTRVASKTGNITRINHDAAIVYPAGRDPYVLVVLTRGFTAPKAAHAAGREISARVYQSASAKF
ncbi:serine hydrolase [soil metagenome]